MNVRRNPRTVWLLPMVLVAWSSAASGEKKVTLCHLPPGNPGEPQTISVGEAAVSAHLAHGDQVEACAALSDELRRRQPLHHRLLRRRRPMHARTGEL